MPLHFLSPREVQVARDGDHPDGGGLLLRVRAQRAVWVFRYTSPAGRRRDAGFGIVHRDSMSEAGESLRQARDRARRARDSLAAGIDFLDQKRSEREAVVKDRAAAKAQREAQHMTLARYARRYHETQIEPKFNPKYASVWIASLERHMPSEIWYKPIAEVGVVELYEALAAVKRELPETADRMRRPAPQRPAAQRAPVPAPQGAGQRRPCLLLHRRQTRPPAARRQRPCTARRVTSLSGSSLTPCLVFQPKAIALWRPTPPAATRFERAVA